MKARATLIILILVTLVFALGLSYEVWFIKSSRNTAAEALSAAQTKLGIDTWSRTMRAIQIEYKNELATLDAATLTRTKLVNLIDLLESSGKKLGLALTISSVKDDPKIKTDVHVIVDTLGTWQSALSFVHLLENLPYKVIVEDSNLNREEGKWRGTSTLRISVAPETP